MSEISPPRPEPTVQAQAQEGEAQRSQGQFANAIAIFDKIIAAGKADTALLSWTYARRGAAKVSVGFYQNHDGASEQKGDIKPENGALEDFEQATEIDPKNGWAWAQLGEVRRTLARDQFRILPQSDFDALTRRSIAAFDRAFEYLPQQRAWLHAHRAAAHFVSIWRKYDLDNPTLDAIPPDDADVQLADTDFACALRENPNYGWAKRFYAFLKTLIGEYSRADSLLSDAMIDDPDASLHILRSLSMLYRYSAAEAGITSEERITTLRRSVRAAAQVMYRDPEDYFAIYTHAAAIADADYPDARQVCLCARDQLLNGLARMTSFALILHERAGEPIGDFARVIGDILDSPHRDIELATILRHDPHIALTQRDPTRTDLYTTLRDTLGRLIQKEAKTS